MVKISAFILALVLVIIIGGVMYLSFSDIPAPSEPTSHRLPTPEPEQRY
ncbi:MAG: hypothetical protein AB8B77_06845 [Alphaproteobacteria bacterium]